MAARHTVDDLFRLSREERRRLRVGKRRSRGRHREKRKKLDRESLLDYLRRNDFQTSRALQAGRRPGDPTVGDYRKEFGSWKNAKVVAFGEPFPFEVTFDYLVKVVAIHGLWTQKKYMQAHRENPTVVPSYWYVEKEFKRWGTLRYYAERYDGRRMLQLYLRLRRQLGREPTHDECKEREIDKYMLEQIFGGEKYFRQNVEMMVKDEKRT